ncbi:MAG: hypothetical protein QW358_04040 [Candidatus Hadarchaeum sp.]
MKPLDLSRLQTRVDFGQIREKVIKIHTIQLISMLNIPVKKQNSLDKKPLCLYSLVTRKHMVCKTSPFQKWVDRYREEPETTKNVNMNLITKRSIFLLFFVNLLFVRNEVFSASEDTSDLQTEAEQQRLQKLQNIQPPNQSSMERGLVWLEDYFLEGVLPNYKGFTP